MKTDNEVMAPIEPQIVVHPSQIDFKNFDQLERQMKAYASKYEGYVATEATVKDDKQLRADLKKVVTFLDSQRKEVKRNYNEPLKAFESQIKKLESIVNDVIEPIDAGVRDLEEKARELWRQMVQEQIDEMAPKYGIEASEIEIKSEWLNKSITTKKLLDGIGGEMVAVKQDKDKLANDIDAIEKYCESLGLEPGGYIDQVKSGSELVEVMTRAANNKQLADEQAEQERKRQEAQQAIEQLKHETVEDRTVDVETGEVIDEQPALYSCQLELVGTKQQTKELKQFMADNDIKSRSIIPMEVVRGS